MRYFTKDHEWIDVAEGSGGHSATVGITDYAQGQLGDIVFVELPADGTKVVKGAEAAVVESVKAASDVYSPVSGTVTGGNPALEAEPALVNSAPESDGWFFTITLDDASELDAMMDESAYKTFVGSL